MFYTSTPPAFYFQQVRSYYHLILEAEIGKYYAYFFGTELPLLLLTNGAVNQCPNVNCRPGVRFPIYCDYDAIEIFSDARQRCFRHRSSDINTRTAVAFHGSSCTVKSEIRKF